MRGERAVSEDPKRMSSAQRYQRRNRGYSDGYGKVKPRLDDDDYKAGYRRGKEARDRDDKESAAL